MKALNICPVLYTNVLDKTVEFYSTQLDFDVLSNEPGQWALMQNGAVQIIVSLPNAHTEFIGPQFSGSLYIRVDDVEALWQRLRDSTTIVYELEIFEWGMQEFAIRDTNGYVLQFAQDMSMEHRPDSYL